MTRPSAEGSSDPVDRVVPSFEAATERLAAIVEQLEGGELPLEKSLELFEEGVRLARSAQERLDGAEKRVQELLGVEGGKPITRDLDP
jgi:exodeoxyribonuclease VII small subunit